MQGNSEVYEGEVFEGHEGQAPHELPAVPMALPPGAGMVQSRTPYVTAMQVMKPRRLEDVEKNILKQAVLLGDEAFYGWGAGKGRVEGGSIDLAMVMINAYGNAVVVPDAVQETPEAWIFTHVFVDLETGVSTPRQWRESKRSVVDGNMDKERKDAIRFGRGQSKNIRNVILHGMPKWLVNKAIEEAKKGARDKLEKYIEKNGIAAAQTYVVNQLKRYGVTEEQITEKMGKAEVKGLDLDDLVRLSADFKSIDSGQEHASTLFPGKEAPTKLDLKDKLKATISQSPAKKAPEAAAVEAMTVKLGKEPYSWVVTDAGKDYKVLRENGGYLCNCPTGNPPRCLHVLAVERSVSAA